MEGSMASGIYGIQSKDDISILAHPSELSAEPLSLRQILLCTDFSRLSEVAGTIAVDLCKQTGAKLIVFHVCEYGAYRPPTETEAAYVNRLHQEEELGIEAVVSRIRSQGIAVESTTETGHPPLTIVDFIASHEIDLAILGTHGDLGFERMMFGSTAEYVFRNASCPVLVAGPRVARRKEGDSSGPVVFATDFHDPAKQAAGYAVTMANLTASAIHCLHVLPLSRERDGDEVLVSIMTEALHQLTDSANASGTKTEYNVLYDSEVSHAVVDYAKEHHARLLVLGVRSGHKFASHLPPHLTYRMIITAPCPVLTVSLQAVHSTVKRRLIKVGDRLGNN